MLGELIIACDRDSRKRNTLVSTARCIGTCLLAWMLFASTAPAQILRVVTYNIDADTNGTTGQNSGPGLDIVLEAIGNEHLAGHAQPIDVLALQELYGDPTITMGYIVNKLNTFYNGAAVYAYDSTPDLTTNNFGTGNGPSGLIYNTKTVQDLGAASIGTVSSSGVFRAPMRYTLAPKGYDDHSADFTIYVSHMKSGSTNSGGSPTNGQRRDLEAQEIRDDAASLGSSAHIIYAGDYNMDGSTESAYQTMLSSTRNGGVGKAIDTLTSSLSPANTWSSLNSSLMWLYTESAQGGNGSSSGGLRYRDDVQYVTGPMLNQPGVQFISGTLGPFGNNGSINLYGNVTDPNNTALADLAQSPFSASYRTSVFSALSTATDHYPVVADYSFATAVGAPGDYNHSGVVDAADYTLWRSTFGMTGSNLLADGNHNNIVDADDYLIWRRYRTSGSGAGSLTSGAEVPEPAAWLLMLSGCLAYLRRSRLRG
jgi:hypothetical protein